MKAQTPKWFKWSMIVLAVLIWALGMGPLSTLVRSDAVPRVYVQPETREVLVDRASHIEVRVDNVQDLFAVELHITYAPSIIDIVDASALPGVQIGAGDIFNGRSWYTGINQVDEATGLIHYLISLDSSETEGVTGSGSLARIDFVGIHAGNSPITVQARLAQGDGESIECTTENGRVRVVVIPSTATWTPVVSATPTATTGPTTSATVPTQTQTPTSVPPSPTPTGSVTPIVYIEPTTHEVLPDTTSWVDIRIAHAEGLYGAWVLLTYDSQIVEITDSDAAAGVQIASGDLFTGKSWYQVSNEVTGSSETSTGTITYGAQLTFNDPPGPSDGQLARIHFRALALGECLFQFENVILTNQQGSSLAAVQQNGTVRVVSELSVTPTPTPTQPGDATPTPTATASPSPTPLIYLDPGASSLGIGDETDIEVKVSDVTNLYGVEFHIGYNPTVIQILDEAPAIPGTQIAFGAFLSPDSVLQNSVDETLGVIHFAISQAPPTPAKSGGGVVARFRVRALAQGATPLAIHNTALTDADTQGIPHGAIGGFVAVNTRVIAGYVYLQGRARHAGVEIRRDAETLGITQADGSFVVACPVAPGGSLTLLARHGGYLSAVTTFTVPTGQIVPLPETTLMAGDVVGPEEVVARAPGCPGDPTVIRAGPSDARINLRDLAFVGSRFGVAATDPEWEPSEDGCHPEWISGRADVNGDLQVNLFDLVRVGNNFGEIAPQPW